MALIYNTFDGGGRLEMHISERKFVLCFIQSSTKKVYHFGKFFTDEMLLLCQTAPVAVAFTRVLDIGRASDYFMISSREITPKHLILKCVVFYYQLLSFYFSFY